jgi:hypothetical protein
MESLQAGLLTVGAIYRLDDGYAFSCMYQLAARVLMLQMPSRFMEHRRLIQAKSTLLVFK